jgi:hypothetical protein
MQSGGRQAINRLPFLAWLRQDNFQTLHDLFEEAASLAPSPAISVKEGPLSHFIRVLLLNNLPNTGRCRLVTKS